MKAKSKKIFDSVQMVREIRDAYYEQKSNPDFDSKKFQRIKKKWSRLLELQKQESSLVNSKNR